jgi:H+-translocating NAD(P) transhydrogenase subunit alpha
MRIAVRSETDGAETRVSATPETVKNYKSLGSLGADVIVQAGAGSKAGVPDAEFEAAGATIAASAAEALKDADVILRVRRPAEGELAGLSESRRRRARRH